ncbi:MAG: protein-(glutamine-N5) methyltransferase, release factor-specific, partial [Pseudomonadota bacterium]|nr:protein-(glutamine-N5) methyltransferase, release factor-specific [Pseudomonadota bacterium]
MQSIKEAIFKATVQINSASPRFDAEILLAHVLKKSRSFCFSHPEQELTTEQEILYAELIERRRQGEPVAYIVGKQGFWKGNFMVTPAT